MPPSPMGPLVDNRYDPPRLSPWWVVLVVVTDVVCIAIAVAAALDGRWFTAAVFTLLTATGTHQHIERRRRHHRALADWRPPAGRPST